MITTVEGTTITWSKHPKHITSFREGKNHILQLWKKHTSYDFSCYSEVCCPIYICLQLGKYIRQYFALKDTPYFLFLQTLSFQIEIQKVILKEETEFFNIWGSSCVVLLWDQAGIDILCVYSVQSCRTVYRLISLHRTSSEKSERGRCLNQYLFITTDLPRHLPKQVKSHHTCNIASQQLPYDGDKELDYILSLLFLLSLVPSVFQAGPLEFLNSPTSSSPFS